MTKMNLPVTRQMCGGVGFLRAIVITVAVSNGAAKATSDTALKPLTVCEVLQDLPRYAGKMVTVVGRLSSNLFDGAWLSEGSCRGLEPSNPGWPYAIVLSCFEETKPAAVAKVDVDEQALQKKLKRLRLTTTLGYHQTLVMSPNRETEAVQRKDTWAVVYGRIKSGTERKGGSFGAVRAKAQLCADAGASVYVEERDGPDNRR